MPGRTSKPKAQSTQIVRSKSKTSLSVNKPKRAYNRKPKAVAFESKPRRVGKMFPKVGAVRAYSSLVGSTVSKENALQFFNPAVKVNQEKAVHVPNSMGSYLTLNSMSRFDTTYNNSLNTKGVYIIYQYTPSNLSFLVCGDNRFLTPFYCTGWTEEPESVRPSRASIALQNITNVNNADGSISVLSLPNPLDWEFDAFTAGDSQPKISTNFYNEIESMMDANPHVKNYSYHDIKSLRNFISCPSSFVGFNTWAEFINYSNMNNAALSGQALIDARAAFLKNQSTLQRCNTLIIKLRLTSTSNSFNIFGYNQVAARYPSNTLISRIQSQPDSLSLSQMLFDKLSNAAQQSSGSNVMVS